LKITTEDLGNRQVMLTIEVDEERVDRALRGVARKVSRDYNIPGFRRGRAPYQVVLQRFGREALLQEALDGLAQEIYQESLESEKLEPYDIGSLEDVQFEPLTLKLRVPLRPVVALGEYRDLRIEPPGVTVDEDEVATELERLRQSNAMLEPAGDRSVEMGDWVSLDVTAQVGDESLLRQESHSMVLDAEDEEFEAGFAAQIVDMKAGDEKQFTLVLGDNWGEDKAGQEAAFDVRLHEVRSRVVPDLDDDLARTVGDFDTLDELRENIRDQFAADAQREADAGYAEEVIEALVTTATVDYPPDMVDDQVGDLAGDLERRLESQGLSVEKYLEMSGQSEDQLREALRPRAEGTLRRGLVLGELARREQIDVAGDEIEQRISLLSASWGERADEVRDLLAEPESFRSIASSLLADKAVQRLISIAKGEAPELEEELDQDSVEETDELPDTVESLDSERAEPAAEDDGVEEPGVSARETEAALNQEADLSLEND
jgi:trigger factor